MTPCPMNETSGAERPASANQIKAIYVIGRVHGLDEAGINAKAGELYGTNVKDLTARMATKFIDELRRMTTV